MNITELTVHELQEKIKNKELTSEEITKAYMDRINEKEKDVEAFVTVCDDALEQSKKIDEELNKENNINDNSLKGIPIGIKDNICTKGIKTTCNSY